MSTTGNREDGITTYITPETDEAEMLEEARYQAEVRELMDSEPGEMGHQEPAVENDGDNLEQATQPDQELTLDIQITDFDPENSDIVATADVRINNVCTIRNVKIRNDDYGLEVVMPKTKIPDTGRLKDACYFPIREMRTQFDLAVMTAYQQELQQTQDGPDQQIGGMGMTL